MNCPKCNCPNAVGATHCQLCYEVFNRSAAERYLHEQKRARMRENGGSHPEDSSAPVSGHRGPSSPFFQPIRDLLAQVDWSGMFAKIVHGSVDLFRKYAKEVAMATAIIALGVGVLFFGSAGQRLHLFGSRLEYDFSPKRPATYWVGFHTELKSWSERDSRLDTPLETFQRDEMANVIVEAAAVKNKTQQVFVKPTEWIVNQSGQLSQNIPLTHPSLKPSEMTLNANGRILKRTAASSLRLGRALVFLTPLWPNGSKRTGARWDEPIEWVQAIGDWKILWKGKIHWKVIDVETWDKISCLHLKYSADVKPALWAPPEWAHGGVHAAAFRGTASGDVCFDRDAHQIFSNDFLQEGTLTIPIDNIYRIPADLRVGRAPRHRWGQAPPAQPGVIVMQLKERLGIHTSATAR